MATNLFTCEGCGVQVDLDHAESCNCDAWDRPHPVGWGTVETVDNYTSKVVRTRILCPECYLFLNELDDAMALLERIFEMRRQHRAPHLN